MLAVNINASGSKGDASFTLCLNGIGQISCQNFSTSLLNLSITTTIAGHIYNEAGIRINSGASLKQLDLAFRSKIRNKTPYMIFQGNRARLDAYPSY